jgi:hypothetical protein
MRTRRDEIAESIFDFLDRKLSTDFKRRIPSSDVKEIVYILSDYIVIENFNAIFDHLHKFQTALMTQEEESDSDFLTQLKNI